jgi:hypothetical protein
MPIGYQTPHGAAAIDERALHHMTVWRALSWLGGQLAGLLLGRRLVGQHDPHSTCHRFVGAVAPDKFLSPQRGELLQQSVELLHVIDEWERLFPEKFFPRFATRSGFG